MSSKPPLEKPKLSSSYAQKELDKAEAQFDKFNEDLKGMTLDRMNEAPKEESEPQTKLSQKEIRKTNEVWLKAKRTISSKEPFNEKYRDDYNSSKEYVSFVAENREIMGESITLWTKPFAGMPAEEWEVPVNKVVKGPRYLAKRISECAYHRFIMENRPVNSDGMGMYYGNLAVDTTIQRLDAHPASADKVSIFMGVS